MIQVKNLMNKDLVACTPETSIKEAATLMAESGRAALPVIKNNELVGVISESDLLKVKEPIHLPQVLGFLGAAVVLDNPLDGVEVEKQLKEVLATKVETIMHKEIVSVGPDADVKEAVDIMLHQGLNLIPVMEGKSLVGTISRSDIVRLLAKE